MDIRRKLSLPLRHILGYSKSFRNHWARLGRNQYIVEIVSIGYQDKTDTIEVEYHISNKRLGSKIPLSDFLNSPLVHGVHPKQMYYLGIEEGRALDTKALETKKAQQGVKSIRQRFKQVFYFND